MTAKASQRPEMAGTAEIHQMAELAGMAGTDGTALSNFVT